jgi:hypothetical protein
MRFTVSPDGSIPDRAVNSDIPRAPEGKNRQIPANKNGIATYWRAWLGPLDGQPMLNDKASLEKFR